MEILEEFEKRIINIIKKHTKERKWSKASQIRACKELAGCECADKYPNGHRIANIHKPYPVDCGTCKNPPADTRYLVDAYGMGNEIEMLVNKGKVKVK